MQIIHIFNLTSWQWLWLIAAALLIGFSKTGIGGVSMPVIPIIAGVFGGKASTGIILPMLIVGDVFALYYYNRHGEWVNIKKLLPWTIVGLMLGIIVGNYINDKQFKAIIAVSVFICLFVLVYTEKKGESLNIPNKIWFYALIGAGAGFTSMIGNAAGPLLTIYLLSMGFKKNSFLGTNAWFFFILNIFKIPLQIFFWHNISMSTLTLTVFMIPAIAIGATIGAIVIKRIKEKSFRYIIIGMTFIAAIRLLM